VIEGITGPGGRDGYIHIEDAAELLRMEEPEVSEVAIRMKEFSNLRRFTGKAENLLSGELNKQGKPSSRCIPGSSLPLSPPSPG